MNDHTHPVLTEPTVREHVEQEHGWPRLSALLPTYFRVLVAHQREHRKTAMRKAAS